MKRAFTVLASVCCACLVAVATFAAEPEQQEIEVTARGMGADADAALKDALAQAVLQAAGAFVDSETLMKNEEIVQDQVLTCSDGIVKRFEKLQEPKQNRQGLWVATIKATVQQKILKQKLAEAKLITVKVDNAQDFWAEMVTAAKRREDAIPLIEKALDKINPLDSIRFTVADRQGNQGVKVKPEFKDIGNGRVSVAVPVAVWIDAKRFHEEVAVPLAQALDYLCLSKQDHIIRNHTYNAGVTQIEIPHEANVWRQDFRDSVRGRGMSKSRKGRSGTGGSGSDKLPHFNSIKTFKFEPNFRAKRGKETMELLLNVSRRYNPESQNFVCYTLPGDYIGIFHAKDYFLKKSMLKLSLLDKSGAEIVTSQTPLGGPAVFNHRYMWISPELETNGGCLAMGKTMLLTAELSADDLKDFASFRVVLVPAQEKDAPARGRGMTRGVKR